jgi:hypothetical protein
MSQWFRPMDVDISLAEPSVDLGHAPEIKVKRTRRKRVEMVEESSQIDEESHYQHSDLVNAEREKVPLSKKARIMVEFSKPSALMEFLKNPQGVSLSFAEPIKSLFAEAAKNAFLHRESASQLPLETHADSKSDEEQTTADENFESKVYEGLPPHEPDVLHEDVNEQGPDFAPLDEFPPFELEGIPEQEEQKSPNLEKPLAGSQSIQEVLEGESAEQEEQEEGTEEDNVAFKGWSERTKRAHKLFSSLARLAPSKKRGNADVKVVNFQEVLEGKSKRAAAVLFHEVLVLKSKGAIDISQDASYQDIELLLPQNE